jgi:hypothetical protein
MDTNSSLPVDVPPKPYHLWGSTRERSWCGTGREYELNARGSLGRYRVEATGMRFKAYAFHGIIRHAMGIQEGRAVQGAGGSEKTPKNSDGPYFTCQTD